MAASWVGSFRPLPQVLQQLEVCASAAGPGASEEEALVCGMEAHLAREALAVEAVMEVLALLAGLQVSRAQT